MSILIIPHRGRYLVTLRGEPAIICETFEAALRLAGVQP